MSEPVSQAVRMSKAEALYAALCGAAAAFALGFVWPAFKSTAVFWYYPLERRWALEARPSGLAMDWFGRCFTGTLAGLVAFAIIYVIARRMRPLSRRGFGLWAAWSTTAVLLSMALHVYQLVPRQPVPEPLPAWYQPR